ncbi:MAG: tripartite tricarboxylate transporter TctB family protein [Paracoccaceae bacterium]
MARSVLAREDVVIGLVLVALGVAASIVATNIAQGPQQRTLPPNTVPLICTIGIVLCGAFLAIKGLFVAQKAISLPFDSRQFSIFLLFMAFFLAFEHVDFRLLILVFVPACMALMGCRSWRQLLITPVLTMLGVWGFFVELFKVFLPTWM